MTSPKAASPRSFAALQLPGFRAFLGTYVLAMMADNIEHVISYWVAFEKFHSPLLGGFAVVSHWVPYLGFSFLVGALNDRFDARRLIQIGMALFVTASLGWGYFFITDTLTIPAAMALLVLHGFAGVFWQTSSQVILHDIAGPENIQSAVRLNATGRYLAVFVGPWVGSLSMRHFGPSTGIMINAALYLPCLIWLIGAPYGPKFRKSGPPPKRAVRGFKDLYQTVLEVRGLPAVAAMTMLAGCISFFVGNSYQAQMPGFATDLGLADAGYAYSMLLGADAAGALLAGTLLELRGSPLTTTPRSALFLSFGWGLSLGAFALIGIYPVALVLLFCAGFFELSSSSMAQTIVQLNAPAAIRGRVLGLYNMSAMGLRAFSGITVGLAAGIAGAHVSLAVSAGAFLFALLLLGRFAARQPDAGPIGGR